MLSKSYSFAVAAVGTRQTLTPNFDIGSVNVDNPSGMWLFLRPLDVYVPPYTIGWGMALVPTVRTITLDYVNAPSGGVASAVVGGPIGVRVKQSTVPVDVLGTDYLLIPTLQNLQTSLNNLQTSINTLDTDIKAMISGWGGTTVPLQQRTTITANGGGVTIATADPVKKTVLVSIELVWNPVLSGIPPRGWLSLSCLYASESANVARLMVTPEHPIDRYHLPPGAGISGAANRNLVGSMTPVDDSANQQATVITNFYYQ